MNTDARANLIGKNGYLREVGLLLLVLLVPVTGNAQALDPDVNNDGVVNYLDVSRASSCYFRDVTLASPTVSIGSPLDGATLSSALVDVSGTVSANTEELSVNGVATGFANGAYQATVAGLTSGSNTIAATAVTRSAPDCWEVDLDGNGTIELADILAINGAYGQSGFPIVAPAIPERQAIATVTVFIDDVAPVVEIVSPGDGAQVMQAAIDVSGTVDDDSAVVTVNGLTASNQGGNWSVAGVPLVPGVNVITAIATDPAGNSGTAAIQVSRIVDNTAPVVVITSPADGLQTYNGSVDISGTVDDADASLQINGIPADIVNGQFNLTGLPLSEGTNSIVATAEDASGNIGSDQVTVTRLVDNDAPAVTITSPADGTITTQTAVDVTGTVDDDTAIVQLNGQAVVVVNGNWTVTEFPLTEGPNNLVATAVDDFGNQSSDQVSITLDTVAPVISISTPVDGTEFADSSTSVSGTVDDPTADVVVAGTPVAVDGAGNWSLATLTLGPGTNAIQATATDAAGNQDTDQVSVSYLFDDVPPVVRILSPADGQDVFESTVDVSGTIDDADAEVQLNGQVAVTSGATWQVNGVPVAAGANTLSASAIDPFGNSSTDEVTVNRQTVERTGIRVDPAGRRFDTGGETQQLVVLGENNDGSEEDLTANAATTFASSNLTVATVNESGLVLARNNGTTTVTVNNPPYTATTEISVEVGVTLDALRVMPPSSTLAGSGAVLQLEVEGDFSDGSTRNLTAGSTGTTYESAPAGVVGTDADGLVTSVTAGTTSINVHNEALAATADVTVSVALGSGFLRGEVYDDSRGQPLPGAVVSLLSDGGGELPAPDSQFSDERGQFRFAGQEGEALVSVSATGFTRVDRRGGIPFNAEFTLLDARLTPLDKTVNEIVPAFGGSAVNTDETIVLSLPPGSVTALTFLQMTRISNQGLHGRLPLGWSPVIAVDIAPHGLDLGATSTLSLPNEGGFVPVETLTMARYDENAREWLAVGTALVSPAGLELTADIDRTGQYVLLLPDVVPQSPSAAITGEPLQGVLPPGQPVIADSGSEVMPPVAAASPEARAIGRIELFTASTMPSGSYLQGAVGETFDLLDTTRVVPQTFIQDLVLYQYPAVPSAAELSTEFPITPSRRYTIYELALGRVLIDVHEPAPAIGGSVIGINGGLLSDGDTSLRIANGALAADTIVEVRALDESNLPLSLPQNAAFVGGLAIDVIGASFDTSAELITTRPASVPIGAQVLVTKLFRDESGTPHLKLVALGDAGGTQIISNTGDASQGLEGIRGRGDYFFIRALEPVGFVAGTVSERSGASPQAGVLVTSDASPVADMTGNDGRYAIAMAVGSNLIEATEFATGDRIEATANVASAGDIVALDLTLTAQPPSVTAVAPVDGAIQVGLDTSVRINFSHPMDGNSITDQSFALTGPSGVVDAMISLSLDGRSAVLIPDERLLQLESYLVTASSSIQSQFGEPLVQFTSGFTTLDPTLVRDPTGAINATAPDVDGFITITGGPGTAEPGSPVTVINNTSNVTVTVIADSDGSFLIRIRGTVLDTFTINVRTADGSDAVIPVDSFVFPDGRAAIGSSGGAITVDGPDGPVSLQVPAASLTSRTTFRITPLSQAEAIAELAALGLELPPLEPGSPTFAGALRIDAPGGYANERVDITMPLRQEIIDLAAGAGRDIADVRGLMTRVESYIDENGDEQIGFRQLDSIKVLNGEVSTNSPPFSGVFGGLGGFYFGFLYPQYSVSYVNGRVFIADQPSSEEARSKLGIFDGRDYLFECNPSEKQDNVEQVCKAPRSIVRVFGPAYTSSPVLYTLTDVHGHYAAGAPVASDDVVSAVASRVDAFSAGSSVRSLGGGAPVPDLVMRRRPPPQDTAAPQVRITVPTQSIPLGTQITVTVTGIDNDNRPENIAALESGMQFSVTPVSTGSPGALTTENGTADGSVIVRFQPDTIGAYDVSARMTDLAGNTGEDLLRLLVGPPLVPPGAVPEPGDPNDGIGPNVLRIDPGDGAFVGTGNTTIKVYFNEPVSRTAELPPFGVPLAIKVSPDNSGSSLGGSVSLSDDGRVLTFNPGTVLLPDTKYTVLVETFIQDLRGNGLDQDPITAGQQPFRSSFRTAPQNTTTVINGEYSINPSRSATIVGNVMFMTDDDVDSNSGGRIKLFDISNATSSAPKLLSEIVVGGQPKDFVVLENFQYLGFRGDGPLTFPVQADGNGLNPVPPGSAQPPGTLLVALVYKGQNLLSGQAGSFLQFYDIRDPGKPLAIGANQRVSFGSIGTRLSIVGDRAIIKLADSPNPGLAIADLRLALIKSIMMPIGDKVRKPDGSVFAAPERFNNGPLVDSPCPTGAAASGITCGNSNTFDFEGVDLNGDGDYGDVGDWLPDILPTTDIVAGRVLTPGDTSDFVVRSDGQVIFVTDGWPANRNGARDQEPNTGLFGNYYGTGWINQNGLPEADASGALAVISATQLTPLALLDFDGNGLDDRVIVRINAPTDDTDTASTRIALAEQIQLEQRARINFGDDVLEVSQVSTRDLVAVSNALAGVVSLIDVTAPTLPVRIANIDLNSAAVLLGGIADGAYPVEMSFSGDRLYVEVLGMGTLTIDLNKAIYVDQTGPGDDYLSTEFMDADNDGIDDRIVGWNDSDPGNGDRADTGISTGGALDSNNAAAITAADLPAVEIVRFTGSAAELAQFDSANPGNFYSSTDYANLLENVARLEPADFLTPGRLHQDPRDSNATDPGDRTDPDYVYFVRTRLPAGVGESVPVTVESMNVAGLVLPAPGFAYPPTGHNSPFEQANATNGARTLKLHRQIRGANLDPAQLLDPISTLYISDPIFVTREPLREADLSQNDGPFLLYPGDWVRASLAKSGNTVASIYRPFGDNDQKIAMLAEAKAEARSLRGDLSDSPDPEPPVGGCTTDGVTGGGVHCHNGEFSMSATDLAIKGRGLDYVFHRTYESHMAYDGPLGWNWDFNYNQRLIEVVEGPPQAYTIAIVDRDDDAFDLTADIGDILSFNGQGRRDLYKRIAEGPQSGGTDPLLQRLDLYSEDKVVAHYQAPPGHFRELLKLRNGGWVLIDSDATLRYYDKQGRLEAIEDRNGNRQELVYEGHLLRSVIDAMGRRIRFGYYLKQVQAGSLFKPQLDVADPQGKHLYKIAKQIDFIDRVIEYEYDDNNSLEKVTLPPVTNGNGSGDLFPNGKELIYTYEQTGDVSNPRFSFKMESFLAPRKINEGSSNMPRVANQYGSGGRLEAQTSGQNSGQSSSISYSGPMTTVTDRRGNTVDFETNANREGTEITISGTPLPSGAITTSITRNEDGLPTRIVLGEGNTIEYGYDSGNTRRRSNGNMLCMRRLPTGGRGNGGTAGPLVTFYGSGDGSSGACGNGQGTAYEYISNQSQYLNDPDPAIPATTFEYDGNGNLEFVRRPLSINEDREYNSFGQLTLRRDGERNVTTYSYFAESRPDDRNNTIVPTEWTRELDATTGGYLASVTVDPSSGDNVGVGTAPASGVAPTLLTTRYDYRGAAGGYPDIGYAGNATSVTDSRGVTTDYGINALNQVYRIVHAASIGQAAGNDLGYVEKIFFDANNQVFERHIQQGGSETEATIYNYTYDVLDNLTSMSVNVPAIGSAPEQTLTTSYAYDNNQNLRQKTLPRGTVVDFVYDARNRLLSETYGVGAPESPQTSYSYDTNDNVIAVTDGLGRSVSATYDAYDRPLTITDRDTNVTQYTYDENDLVLTEVVNGFLTSGGARGDLRSVQHGYDEVYRRISSEELILGGVPVGNGSDGGNSMQYTYDRNNRVTSTTDDNGNTTELYYDGANRQVGIVDALGNSIAYAYDNGQNILRTIEREIGAPLDYVSTATYDALNRVLSSTDPANNTRSYGYDALSNRVFMRDAEGNVTNSSFDAISRLILTEQVVTSGGPNIRTRYTLDPNGNLETITDGAGKTTTFGYDLADRQTSTQYPDGAATRATYDRNSNVVTFTDQNGNEQTNTYDNNDRLEQRSIAVVTNLGDLETTLETYRYDGLNRMTFASDNDSEVVLQYDSLSRVVGSQADWLLAPGGVRGYAVSSQYDGVGNRLAVDYPSGLALDYQSSGGTGYDTLNRVDRIHRVSDNQLLVDYDYVGTSRITAKTLGNGVNLNVTYDNNRRPTILSHLSNTVPTGVGRRSHFELRYAWTRESQRVGEQRVHRGGLADTYDHDSIYRTSDARINQRFTDSSTLLDGFGQISESTLPVANFAEADYRRDFTIDTAHNLESASESALAALVPNFPASFGSATARNQYERLVEGSDVFLPVYDFNGNTTRFQLEPRAVNDPLPGLETADVDYDYRNQPVQVRYFNGDRVAYRYDPLGRRIEKQVASGGQTTRTMYVSDGAHEIEERNAFLPDADNLMNRYVFGRGIDEPIMMERNVGSTLQEYYYHANSIGSIVGLTDASGIEVEDYRYDTYGSAIIAGADYTPPQVLQIRNTGTAIEIDFTEAIRDGEFSGLINIDGLPADAEFAPQLVTVAGSPVQVFRATLRVNEQPLVGLFFEVDPGAANEPLLDEAGNEMVDVFQGPVPPVGAATANVLASGYTGPELRGASDVENPYMFQGRRLDPETGLYYYRARYYSPYVGRFLQNDPKGYEDGPNLYGAFGGNPVNALDPHGTEWYSGPKQGWGSYIGGSFAAGVVLGVRQAIGMLTINALSSQQVQSDSARSQQALAAGDTSRALKIATGLEEYFDLGSGSSGIGEFAAVAMGKAIGVNDLMEAGTGATIHGEDLSTGERVMRGVSGTMKVASTVATVAGSTQSMGHSIRARTNGYSIVSPRRKIVDADGVSDERGGIVVVQTRSGKRHPFYESSGNNSGRSNKGEWRPFEEFFPDGYYRKPPGATHTDHASRFGTPELHGIGKSMQQAGVPKATGSLTWPEANRFLDAHGAGSISGKFGLRNGPAAYGRLPLAPLWTRSQVPSAESPAASAQSSKDR